jgi:lysozyme
MATPIRKVLDISHHNNVNDIEAIKDAGILGIIHKSTEGSSYVDDTYAERKADFIDAGFLWGAYHFAHPGDVEDQVQHFLKTAGIDDKTLYALDWEEASSGVMSEGEAEEFCYIVEQMTGRKCVIYSGNSAKEEIDGINEYLGSHRLWLAQYGSNPVCQPSWDKWWLWQYSDGEVGPDPHGCPGLSGYVDTNSWTGSDQQLINEWSGTGKPQPMPTPGPRVATVGVQIYAPKGVIVKVNVKQGE